MSLPNMDIPLYTTGGLGKVLKGNMQDTNIFWRLESEHKGRPRKPGQVFMDDRVESNIIGEYAIQLFKSAANIKTLGD